MIWGRGTDLIKRGKNTRKGGLLVNKCMNLEVTIRHPPLHEVAIAVTDTFFYNLTSKHIEATLYGPYLSI